MGTRTKNPVMSIVVVVSLLVGGGWWLVTNMHRVGRAEDTVAKWAAPKRMTKPRTAERPTHTVKFVVEALPVRVLTVTAHAGTGQSMGPTEIEAGRWSWTANGVSTGEFAELTAEDVGETGATRCWILVDGKLYRNGGKDKPYNVANPCTAVVVVG